MAVCRKRSTNSAPDSLSISYFTGSPPSGISMIAFTSQGGLRPIGIFEMSMDQQSSETTLVSADIARIAGLRWRHRRIQAHEPQEKQQAGNGEQRRREEEARPAHMVGQPAAAGRQNRPPGRHERGQQRVLRAREGPVAEAR